MADREELDMENSGAQELVQSPALDEDFLRWKVEAQALKLSAEATASYIADQHRQLHQLIMFENDMQQQQRHRDEQHQLYMDQQEAVHMVKDRKSVV